MKLSNDKNIKSLFVISAAMTVYLFGVVVTQAGAVESETEDQTEVVETSVESVPSVGSFGEMLMKWGERIQLMTTRNTEKKLELEQEFAKRRLAQMEKLEALPDDFPKKEELINRVEENHQEIIDRIEQQASGFAGSREELIKRIETLKANLEARKERVEQKQAERKEKVEDLQARIQEKKLEMKEMSEEKKAEIKNLMQTKKVELKNKLEEKKVERVKELKEAKNTFKERVRDQERVAKEKEIEAKKDPETKFEERVMEMKEDKVMGTDEQSKVKGAMDYQPTTILEKLGYWLQGRDSE